MQALIEAAGGGRLAGVRWLLRAMLESGRVDGVYVALRHPAGDAVSAALVRDPALLELADPFAPVLPVSGARLLSMLTRVAPRPRLAAVLRNCELRALVELVKLQQASLDGVTLVGVECTGTYEVSDYARLARGAGPADAGLRQACRMCEYPVPALAEITLQQIGLEEADGLYLEVQDGSAWGADLAGLLGQEGSAGTSTRPQGAFGSREPSAPAPAPEVGALAPSAAPASVSTRETALPAARAGALQALLAERLAERDRVLAGVAERTATPAGLADWFSTCLRCHNCMTNCPICYCKTCFFKTDVFDHEPMQFIQWAGRKGATRLPPDTLLFHLTRMNHMATSCVGCGLCTSACPSGIAVGAAFRAVAARTQALFGYQAGRSLDEAPPVTTFQVDEMRERGE